MEIQSKIIPTTGKVQIITFDFTIIFITPTDSDKPNCISFRLYINFQCLIYDSKYYYLVEA